MLEPLEPRHLLATYGLDLSFSDDGSTMTEIFASGDDLGRALEIQQDGSIFVAGRATNGASGNSDFALVRYRADGSVDWKAFADFGAGDDAWGIALQSDGKTLLSGTDGSQFAIARFTTDGALDSSFDGDGKVTIPAAFLALQILVQSDGKILVAGGSDQLVVVRLNASGSLDTSYGDGGIATTNFAMSRARGVDGAALDSSGRLVLVGTEFTPEGRHVVLLRFDQSGNIDLQQISDFGIHNATANDLAIQNDGKFVIAAYTPDSSLYDPFLVRLNPDGSLDPTFGAGGVTPQFLGDFGLNIELTADQKILLCIDSFSRPGRTIRRFNTDGTLDASFANGGVLTVSSQVLPGYYADMAFQPDGRLVLAGSSEALDEIAVARLNLTPELALNLSSASYTENAARISIAPGAIVQDADNTNFNRGSLTASLAFGTADDRFAVRNQGSGAGQIGISQNNITYGGTVIGSFLQSSSQISVALNVNATAAAVQSLIRNLTFETLGDAPSTAPRIVSVALSDGVGGLVQQSMLVRVVKIDDAPVASSFGPNLSFTEGGNATPISETVNVTDVDSADFAGGQVTVRFIANGQGTDRLFIRTAGNIATSGANVLHAGSVIGTFSGGNNGTPLVVALNSAATASKVAGILRNVMFSNVSENPSPAPRTLWVRIFDGDGVGDGSVPVTKQVFVIPVNDAPVLGGIGGGLGYRRNAPPVFLATTGTVRDADSLNFAGGKLTVRAVGGDQSTNRLEIRGTVFTIDANRNVIRSGIVIGTVNAGGGVGATRLIVTFNAQANAAIVQQLVRAIAFRTVGSTSAAQRTVSFSVTDGDNGTSLVRTKTVNLLA